MMRPSQSCSDPGPVIDQLLREHAAGAALAGLRRATGRLTPAATAAVTRIAAALTSDAPGEAPPWLWGQVAIIARIWAHHTAPHPGHCASVGAVCAEAGLPRTVLCRLAETDRRHLPVRLAALATGETGWCFTRLHHDWTHLALNRPSGGQWSPADRARTRWIADYDTAAAHQQTI